VPWALDDYYSDGRVYFSFVTKNFSAFPVGFVAVLDLVDVVEVRIHHLPRLLGVDSEAEIHLDSALGSSMDVVLPVGSWCFAAVVLAEHFEFEASLVNWVEEVLGCWALVWSFCLVVVVVVLDPGYTLVVVSVHPLSLTMSIAISNTRTTS
jgi:hypothetical protein